MECLIKTGSSNLLPNTEMASLVTKRVIVVAGRASRFRLQNLIYICSRPHHSPSPLIPMTTSHPSGRLSTQNSLNPNTSSVSRFSMLFIVFGSLSLRSRLKRFRILFKLMWLPHSPLPAEPFQRSRTTVSNNRMERESRSFRLPDMGT